MPSLPNFYEILQVSPNAEQEVIHAAYKRLSLKYHPDTNPSPDANERMRQFIEAYEIIGNPTKRKEYDRQFKKQQARSQPQDAPDQSPPSPSPSAARGVPTPVCPQCKSADKIKRISAIIDTRASPVLAQSLEAPPQPTYPVEAPVTARIGRRSRLDEYQKQVQDYSEAMVRWKRVMQLWSQLFYCDRDACVFLPGVDQSAPLLDMVQYLYNLEENMPKSST